jgi:hypothetical protein
LKFSQSKLTIISDAISRSSEVVKLASNDGNLEVPVHKELLCFFSSYYAAALKGGFSEAQKERFEVALSGNRLMCFITWLYTGGIVINKNSPCRILALYIFADQMDIIALRRDAISQFSKIDLVMIFYDQVQFVLENVTQHSQLYRWVLDSYINHWEPEDDDDDPCLLDSDADPDNLLADFIYQVMRGIAISKSSGDRDSGDFVCCNSICQYHEHSSKEEWEASTLTQSP